MRSLFVVVALASLAGCSVSYGEGCANAETNLSVLADPTRGEAQLRLDLTLLEERIECTRYQGTDMPPYPAVWGTLDWDRFFFPGETKAFQTELSKSFAAEALVLERLRCEHDPSTRSIGGYLNGNGGMTLVEPRCPTRREIE